MKNDRLHDGTGHIRFIWTVQKPLHCRLAGQDPGTKKPVDLASILSSDAAAQLDELAPNWRLRGRYSKRSIWVKLIVLLLLSCAWITVVAGLASQSPQGSPTWQKVVMLGLAVPLILMARNLMAQNTNDWIRRRRFRVPPRYIVGPEEVRGTNSYWLIEGFTYPAGQFSLNRKEIAACTLCTARVSESAFSAMLVHTSFRTHLMPLDPDETMAQFIELLTNWGYPLITSDTIVLRN